ncbi:hypothetical protein ACQKLP_07715 [Chitinophaga sp. NPDC101104]|uniref:hypothetical protein n=1 Tax=Chitinophaga sp. NPDC101104 TaxID=3390561 RepID=UPI003D050142
MKRIIAPVLAMLLLFACTSHENNDNVTPKPQPPKGAVRPIGTSLGAPVTKTIGAAGGDISSADGKLKITVPAGAIAANTQFSVEPISNTLPGSPGIAYRLRPEGVKFAKPLTLQFTYTAADLDSTHEEALFMAYQAQNGIWRMLPKTQLDKQAKTLTVQTDHFSDWAPYAMFWLTSGKDAVKVKESTLLSIHVTEDFLIANLNQDEVEIAREKVLEKAENVKNWKMASGGGTITPDAKPFLANYTAPAKPSNPNPVTVSVEIHNFIPAGMIPGRGTTGKAILFKKIRIVEDTWHYGTIAGQDFNTVQHWYFADPFALNIEGIISATSSIMLTIKIGAPATGNYGWDIAQPAATAQAVYLPGGPGGWLSGYTHCKDGYDINSPGSVSIEKVEVVGGTKYVEGQYTVTVYNAAVDCNPPAKLIRGFFRVKSR